MFVTSRSLLQTHDEAVDVADLVPSLSGSGIRRPRSRRTASANDQDRRRVEKKRDPPRRRSHAVKRGDGTASSAPRQHASEHAVDDLWKRCLRCSVRRSRPDIAAKSCFNRVSGASPARFGCRQRRLGFVPTKPTRAAFLPPPAAWSPGSAAARYPARGLGSIAADDDTRHRAGQQRSRQRPSPPSQETNGRHRPPRSTALHARYRNRR